MNEVAASVRPSAPDFTARLTSLFAEEFETDDVDGDSDFFKLGGDSLVATALMASIEREFGATLPVSVLLEAATPRQLADAVASALGQTRHSSLVPVRAQGDGPPLFCVHGMEGTSMLPGKLAAGIARRPIYAVRAIGLARGEVPPATVAEIAAGYMNEIKSVQPRGPYLILGQCGPSFVAYELAQQLLRSGDKVAALILADPAVAEQMAWRVTDPAMRRMIMEGAGQKVARALQRARANPDLPGEGRVLLVSAVLSGAIGGYLPQPYPGETLLVYSAPRRQKILDPKRGLPAFVAKLTAVQGGKSHHEIFHGQIQPTTTAIGAFLDRVCPIAIKPPG